jgi:hypothetical protein
MRALCWHDVDVTGQSEADPPIPSNVALVRSVRAGGDTKTKKSRRADASAAGHRRAPGLVGDTNLRACDDAPLSVSGVRHPYRQPLEARNVRCDFRKVVDAAGLAGKQWVPRNYGTASYPYCPMRVPIESISRLVGHRSTTVTETI